MADTHENYESLDDLLSDLKVALAKLPVGKEMEKDLTDHAMTINKTGGIDLTPANMNLQTKNGFPLSRNDGGMAIGMAVGIKFHLDPAMLAQLQNAPGFVPVIISVKPIERILKSVL